MEERTGKAHKELSERRFSLEQRRLEFEERREQRTIMIDERRDAAE